MRCTVRRASIPRAIAGPGADDAANNRKLLADLAAVPDERRTARYRCAMVYLRWPADPSPLIAQAAGKAASRATCAAPAASATTRCSSSRATGAGPREFDAAEKNRVSHRGQALRALVVALGAAAAAS